MDIRTKVSRKILRSMGINPFWYKLLEDRPDHIIVVHRITHAVKYIRKGERNNE